MLWMLALLATVVAAEPVVEPTVVVLHVGVHRDAGTIYDIAADGASGQCEVVHSRLYCPASGPVQFRWGGSEGWSLSEAVVLQPGQSATSWVLATEASRVDQRARLDPAIVTADDVRDLFVRTGADPVDAPSLAMLSDLWALADHEDPVVRLTMLDAVVPWWRHTASDPMPADAPPLVPIDLLDQLADDPDRRVRRRLANRLREVRGPGNPLRIEAQRVLLRLVGQGGGVQRAAMASLSIQGRGSASGSIVAWDVAMDRVTTPGPPGRAAANTLGHLAGTLGPDEVDPAEAVERVFIHHRERTWNVWAAWLEHVPFEAARAEALLRDTEGLSPRLVRRWAETHPDDLALLLTRWEPSGPHSQRFRLVARALADVEHPAIRHALRETR